MKFIRNYKLSLPAAGVTILGLAWVAFGYFGVHTAFIDDKVAEARPTFDTPAVVAEPADTSAPVDTPVAPVDTAEAPAATDVGTVEPADDAAPETTVAAAPEPEPEPEVEAAPAEIVTEFAGDFSGQSRYDVSGDAIVLGNGTDQRFLRFENFESSNGPDLNVYLFNPDDSSDFIDLGDLSGNIGDQNYEIPADVDLERYSQVSIWCVRFGVGFGTADLVPAA